jgi:hypothetical protein
LTGPRPVSSWLLTGLGLDTLRQQVQGTWSQARLQACLPRLHRFLVLTPRRREHQETAVRAWLTGHASPWSSHEQQAAEEAGDGESTLSSRLWATPSPASTRGALDWRGSAASNPWSYMGAASRCARR